jgi:hypothetical protein
MTSITKITKSQFDQELHKFLEEESKRFTNVQWFPFWCDGKEGKGHPLEASLLVIGYNPSSGVEEPWEMFWHPEAGFDMKKFQEARNRATEKYNKQRPSKRPRPAISPTRKRIKKLAEETIRGGTVVNTNVYWAISTTARTLPRESRSHANIKWLLDRIPKNAVVVTHGRKAEKAYKELQLNPKTFS